MGFDYRRRQVQLQERIRKTQLGAVIVSGETDVRWLTGLVSSNAAALATADDIMIVTDGRYAEAARQTGLPVTLDRDVVGECIAEASRRAIEPALRSVDGQLISELRLVKDAAELAALRRACDISVAALQNTVGTITVGDTELMIARRLEFEMATLGAEDRSFPSIVAAGPNSAVPHHQPTSVRVKSGDVLKIDFGASVEGYHADCTRTFVVGADPTMEQLKIHAFVAQAAAAARAALLPGATCADIDASARSVIDNAGYGGQFVHGLGHGVGLDVHEPPLLAATSLATLEPGNVVTIEPGIYQPGSFGVRIEDMCLVTKVGADVLTSFPRELMRVG